MPSRHHQPHLVRAQTQVPCPDSDRGHALAKRVLFRRRPFRLEPYSTRTFDFYFYFPETGDFPVYPVQVASELGRLAGGKPFVFKVVEKLSKRDETSWAWVSQNGTEKEVIQYLRDHNMNRIALDKIAFRMRNEKEEETGSTFSRRPSICSPTVSPTTHPLVLCPLPQGRRTTQGVPVPFGHGQPVRTLPR